MKVPETGSLPDDAREKTEIDDVNRTGEENSHLSIDELILSASYDDDQPFDEKSPWKSKHEIDILMTKEQSDAIYGSRERREKRKSHESLSRRWSDNKVMYRYLPENYTSAQWRVVVDAMREWENLTCLTFHEDRDKNSPHFVHFVTGYKSCWSNVGMTGGRQLLNLAPRCFNTRVVLHEIGHAIGFWHEHSRTDRDSYVKIVHKNIKEGEQHNFDKHNTNNYNVPYDYLSLMHYYHKAWSRNGNSTILSLSKDPKYQKIMGYAQRLSFYDVMLANKMYECDANCDQSEKCPSDAYRDKDCKCYCRSSDDSDPIEECQNITMKNASTTAPKPHPTTAPTFVPTSAPTGDREEEDIAPTTAPTTVPTTAPTTAPITAPKTAPTTAPSSTNAPTTALSTVPITAPTTDANGNSSIIYSIIICFHISALALTLPIMLGKLVF